MSADTTENTGPDLTQGVSLADFGDQPLLYGHVGDEPVILARMGDEITAVGARCTHYGGPLEEGLVVGETIHCPWHHACFSLRSGEALGAPAFDPLPCWQVEREGDRVFVRNKTTSVPPVQQLVTATEQPKNIVIVGGGAAGFACAEMLRRRGYDGQLTILSDDADAPCDRPNLSKDYLAGTAPEEWMSLRSEDYYKNNHINLQLDTHVQHIDTVNYQLTTREGRNIAFDRLVLATGAEPVRLPIPGQESSHVFTLRSFADSRRIIEHAHNAKTAVMLGSGFIGLEVAAALRTRGLVVHVVSLDQCPLQNVLGSELGNFIRSLHEEHGVIFHMETSLTTIEAQTVTLSNGTKLEADLVILGVGVRPRTALAESAGLHVDKGILVDEYLQTNVPGIYAAGDVARWHDTASGQALRIEHWVVAERQGQIVAENLLGARKKFQDIPFFWSVHYDLTINYAGHAQTWDSIEIDGNITARDCILRYQKNGTTVAVAAIGRDKQVLEFAAKNNT